MLNRVSFPLLTHVSLICSDLLYPFCVFFPQKTCVILMSYLICVKHPEVWKATDTGRGSGRAAEQLFFSNCSGWRTPSYLFQPQNSSFFFSPPPYFFVRLPALRRPFSFPTSAEEQSPKFRVVVCRTRACGNAPPLRFSQVVWMFFPLPRLFWP